MSYMHKTVCNLKKIADCINTKVVFLCAGKARQVVLIDEPFPQSLTVLHEETQASSLPVQRGYVSDSVVMWKEVCWTSGQMIK